MLQAVLARLSAPIGQKLAELVDLEGHLAALLGEKALDRDPKARLADPVRAVGRHRLVAALQLVLPLRAGLDARQAVLDREVDGPVVAGLEVEEIELLPAAPDAAVERVVAQQVERAGDAAPAVARP